MGLGHLLARLTAAIGVLLLAAPALAADFCHAETAMAEEYASVSRVSGRWRCGDEGLTLAAERTYLRFAIAPGEPRPTAFTTRLTRFEGMRIVVTGRDGRSLVRDYREADMQPVSGDWKMIACLP